VGRSDDEGSVADWQRLHKRCGNEVLTVMYERMTKKMEAGKKINYSAALQWVADNTTETE
jgi:hypothetical protein